MKTETAHRCLDEIRRFMRAWDACNTKFVAESKNYSEEHMKWVSEDWLFHADIGKERAALRRASLDLSNALADLRQGR